MFWRAGDDFASLNEMLTFTSLTAFQNLTIVVYDDGKNETGEYFEIMVVEVLITNTSGAEIIIPDQQMISIRRGSRFRVPIFDCKYSFYCSSNKD